MNVLIATYLVPTSPSGVVTYCRTLARDLTGAGVTVQTIDATDTPVLWRKGLGVLKRIMRALGGASAVVYDEFAYFTGLYLGARKFRRSPIDLIHAQDARTGVAVWMALGRKVPVVLTCHFNDDPVHELVEWHDLKPGFTKQLTRWYTYLFSFVHYYIFTSDYARSKSTHLLPTDIDKRILYNTVQVNVPARLTPSTDAPELIISNVGLIDERKNQQLLLRIGHELCRRGIHNFMIWLIGDGPKRAEYTRLVNELGLTDHVIFYGQQSAPWQWVAQSDLYVHTSLNDNCPYSIVEAFAVETPVLALPVGGIPEMLPNGRGALHGTNVSELTDEVARYFDPALRQTLASEQAVYAKRTFNRDANLGKLLSFYGEITGSEKPTATDDGQKTPGSLSRRLTESSAQGSTNHQPQPTNHYL